MAQPERLDTLAQQINEEHRAFLTTFRKTLQHAIKLGELLTQAKEQCPYGTWLPWLERNFEGAARTAQDYMSLYKGRDKIRANARDSAHLSVSGALKEIAASERPEGTRSQSKNVGLTRTRVAGELNWAHVTSPKREGPSEHDDDESHNTAEDLSEEKGEPFSAEERQDASRDAEDRNRAEQRKRHTPMFMEADGRLSKARRELKKALDAAREVEFSDEEVELLVRQGEAARDMASLFIAAVSGDSGTDWDAELFDLEQRRQWGPEWGAED
jgi:hypothetical protein